jgi:cell division transport system ATP-binding protein
VAIARALVNQPDILIADEPTGNLDPELSWEILRLFEEINRKGTTVLLATHEPGFAETVGGRVLSMRQGRVEANLVTDPGGRLDATNPIWRETPGEAP